ncbi:MAG: cytochrome c biogenesis protein ResB [Phycisphaerae bacterium]|nr:cytochrome c biogenesis protein ResB [Phycisphaerae bacterium]
MRKLVKTIGSLKLAVVLLVGVSAAMSAASVYEAQHGTEAALRVFYRSLWFAALLGALGVNVLAALVARWPFRASQAGFVTAHVAVLAILLGAWVTRVWGIDGRLWLRPEETRSDFDGGAWALRLQTADGKASVTIPVGAGGPVVSAEGADKDVDGVRLEVEEYAADTIDEGERIIADPNGPQPAMKIRLGHGPHDHEQWVMGGRPEKLGMVEVRLFRVTDAGMLKRLLTPTSAPGAPNQGRLSVEVGGERHVIDVREQADKEVPLGATGYRVRVRRYLPHAMVGQGGIQTASSRPVNPMIEFDVTDPSGKTEPHRVFARFPDRDFASTHMSATAPATSQPITFRYLGATMFDSRQNGIDILLDAAGKLHARFSDGEGRVTVGEVALNRPTETPWDQTRITVVEVYPGARNERALKPIAVRISDAMPAAFVCLRTDRAAHRLWVRKGESYDVHLGGKHVQVSYGPERIPLGYSVKLVKPIITYYPGTERARTYESRVSIEDGRSETKLERTVSMNAPLEYGGYSFYQSSYQFGRNNEPIATMLSVVSDPGEGVVYAGYAGLVVGMVIILAQKVRRRGRGKGQEVGSGV